MSTEKSKSGLASLSQGRTDVFRVDPRQLHIKDGWNKRDMNDPANIEHIDQLAKSIAEVGVKEPLTVYWEDGKAFIENGECRWRGAIRAIEVYKADVKTIPVKGGDRYANEADRTFSQILLNSGKPFSQLEQAKVFKRLLDLGWQQNDIASKAGISAGRVSQILNLLTLTEPIKAMVTAGNVSASMAVQIVKAEGTAAEQTLKAGLEAAKAEGGTKVKPAHVEAAMGVPKQNIKSIVKEALDHSDIDDDAEELVIIKMPNEQWKKVRDGVDW